ncbi:Metacaspase-1 [Ceratobasidium theobromae]|uniref:Metacaspase-1 n=1 Tax=Ceratobasidium theobromae TaxID=1582974 RepID=A0A5N5QGJ5_9AGAM|nr:Metacaspase-1 [Ceratobasidium theobromae]
MAREHSEFQVQLGEVPLDLPRAGTYQPTVEVPLMPFAPDNASPEERRDRNTKFRDDFVKYFREKRWRAAENSGPQSSSKRRALVIAINYGIQSPIRRLWGTFVDAHKIINVLGKFGYSSNDICVLADIDMTVRDGTMGGITADMSRWPSKENIGKALNWLTGSSRNAESEDRECRFLFCGAFWSCCWTASIANFANLKLLGMATVNCMIEFKKALVVYAGIMPRDVDFQDFTPCQGCVCSDVVKDGVVPKTHTVLWDSNLNQMLTKALQPNTDLTVIFDCCHSGGTLQSAMGSGMDVTDEAYARARGRRANATVQVAIKQLPEGLQNVDMITAQPNRYQPYAWQNVATGRQQSVAVGTGHIGEIGPAQSSPANTSVRLEDFLIGNFLGLPVEINLAEATEPVSGPTQARGSQELISCQLLRDAGVAPIEQAFHETCKVVSV